MAEPFVGQIIQGGWNFAPRGYLECSGQILAIQSNQALFSLLGTTYGGNGTTSFALPDLRGRTMVGQGQGPGLTTRVLGEMSGQESVTLLSTQLPAHNHSATFTNNNSALNVAQVRATKQQPDAAGYLLGRSVDGATPAAALPRIYAPAGSTPTVALGGLNVAGTVAVANAGGNQAHPNMQPYLVVTHVIAVQGIFPSRN